MTRIARLQEAAAWRCSQLSYSAPQIGNLSLAHGEISSMRCHPGIMDDRFASSLMKVKPATRR